MKVKLKTVNLSGRLCKGHVTPRHNACLRYLLINESPFFLLYDLCILQFKP